MNASFFAADQRTLHPLAPYGDDRTDSTGRHASESPSGDGPTGAPVELRIVERGPTGGWRQRRVDPWERVAAAADPESKVLGCFRGQAGDASTSPSTAALFAAATRAPQRSPMPADGGDGTTQRRNPAESGAMQEGGRGAVGSTSNAPQPSLHADGSIVADFDGQLHVFRDGAWRALVEGDCELGGLLQFPQPPPAKAASDPRTVLSVESVPETLRSGQRCYYHDTKPAILVRERVGLCAICIEKAVVQ